jgi:heterotetrameric sarcosine oxidase gamma subunit
VAELTLTDCSPMAKVLIHADPSGALAERLAVPFGRSRRDDDGTLILRVRPAQWLLFADSGRERELVERWEAAAAETDEFVSVIDVTSGRTLLRLTGELSPALLAKICALDLARASNGSALRSSVAKVNAEIVRDDADGRRSYLLACERSYGRFLTEAINDAGEEFSVGSAAALTR